MTNTIIETEDGYLIDTETGEVVGLSEETGKQDPFRVCDMASAEWVLSKMQACDAEITALQLRLEAIQKQLGQMIVEKERRRQFLTFRFHDELEAFARQTLSGAKTKSLRTPYGTMHFRHVNARIAVREGQEPAAIAYLETNLPDLEAVKVSKKVLLTPLQKATDLPFDLFETVPARETFRVDTGVFRRGSGE